MNTSVPLECIQEHLTPVSRHLPNTTECVCQVFYQGTLCEEQIPWFFPLHVLRIVTSLTLTLFILLWALLKLAYNLKSKGCIRPTLSHVALYMFICGCIVAIVHRVHKAVNFQTVDYWYSTESGYAFIVDATLAGIYISFYMAATNIILGFWFSVLTAKLRPVLALRTRLVCIGLALIVLLVSPSGTVITQLGFGQGFIVMIILPVISNSVWFIVMTCIVGCRNSHSTKFESSVKKKARYSLRLFVVLSIMWSMYILYLGILSVGYLAFPKAWTLIEIVTGFYNECSEFVVGFCVLMLIDRHGGVRYLFHYLRTGEDKTRPTSMTTNHTTSSSSIASNNQLPPNSGVVTGSYSTSASAVHYPSKESSK